MFFRVGSFVNRVSICPVSTSGRIFRDFGSVVVGCADARINPAVQYLKQKFSPDLLCLNPGSMIDQGVQVGSELKLGRDHQSNTIIYLQHTDCKALEALNNGKQHGHFDGIEFAKDELPLKSEKELLECVASKSFDKIYAFKEGKFFPQNTQILHFVYNVDTGDLTQFSTKEKKEILEVVSKDEISNSVLKKSQNNR